MTSAGSGHQPSLRLNVAANFAGKIWSITSVYIFVPVYLSILGIDAYGLIAFNAIALALLYVADAGLSASFAREAAKGSPGQSLLDMLVSVERVLLSLLVLAGLAFAAAAPLIADNWLGHAGNLRRDQVIQCLQLMPLALIPQIAMSLYFGGLMGLQRQVSANLLSTGFNIVRSGLVILPIWFFPDIRVFFVWQAAASLAMTVVMRAQLRNQIIRSSQIKGPGAAPPHGRFSAESLRAIRGYALGMLGLSIIAALNTQLDKLVISKLLPLSEFAQYSLVSMLAQIPYLLTLPIATALLPRFTNLLAQKRYQELGSLYRQSSYYIASLGAVAGLALFLFADAFIAAWLNSQPVESATVLAARLLALGGMFLTLQLAPFQLSLANGHNSTNIRLGIIVLCASIPLQIHLAGRYGVVGAALPWLIINAAAFIYLGVVLNRKFPLVSVTSWFFADNLATVLVAGLVLGAARILTHAINASAMTTCIVAAVAALAALGIAHLVFRQRSHPAIAKLEP